MVVVAVVLVVEHPVGAATVAKHSHLRNEFVVGQFAVPFVVVAAQFHPVAAAFAGDHDLQSPPVKQFLFSFLFHGAVVKTNIFQLSHLTDASPINASFHDEYKFNIFLT